jgi:hypothetical protein
MQETTNPLAGKKQFTPNKGFTIMVGDTYIGYLNIGEKKVPAETVKALQNPKVMADILAKATLEPYSQEDRDMSGIADIIANATTSSIDDEIAAELDK